MSGRAASVVSAHGSRRRWGAVVGALAGRNRFEYVEAVRFHILRGLLAHDGPRSEDDVEAAEGAWFELRYIESEGLWEIVDARTGESLPDSHCAFCEPRG